MKRDESILKQRWKEFAKEKFVPAEAIEQDLHFSRMFKPNWSLMQTVTIPDKQPAAKTKSDVSTTTTTTTTTTRQSSQTQNGQRLPTGLSAVQQPVTTQKPQHFGNVPDWNQTGFYPEFGLSTPTTPEERLGATLLVDEPKPTKPVYQPEMEQMLWQQYYQQFGAHASPVQFESFKEFFMKTWTPVHEGVAKRQFTNTMIHDPFQSRDEARKWIYGWGDLTTHYKDKWTWQQERFGDPSAAFIQMKAYHE